MYSRQTDMTKYDKRRKYLVIFIQNSLINEKTLHAN